MYPYGLIGNCQASALVRSSGAIEWLCLPRPDSPPVFGKLLDPDGGEFTIESATDPASARSSQRYLTNTNVLITQVQAPDGEYRIIDFCPRFEQFGRMYRPNVVMRVVELLSGSPQLRVRCQPVEGWEKTAARSIRGNSHLRWDIRQDNLRLTTNMPLTHLCENTPFPLKETVYFALTWSFAIEEDVVGVTREFLDKTIHYWQTWVKHCSTPTYHQAQTIRSALTLKLHCYEDTGAILAGLTTSLPEELGGKRNWDYRFCWLRDAYFVVSAFRNLGHFEEIEGFLKFLLGLLPTSDKLRPVYRIDHIAPLPEIEHKEWKGYANSQPVRSHNEAANHVQNDVYGELVLSLAPIFFDERFEHLRTKEHEDLLAQLGSHCIKSIGQPDAGLWELRDHWREHSFTNLMCWAGLDRIETLQERGFFAQMGDEVRRGKAAAESRIRAAVVKGIVGNGPDDPTLDASNFLFPIIRFPDAELSRQTVDGILEELALGKKGAASKFFYRYRRQDDFGVPESAFVTCSFWAVQALAALGRKGEATEMLAEVLNSASSLGLYSEHYIPDRSLQLGNFPQAYSHVGQINATFSVSPAWFEVL